MPYRLNEKKGGPELVVEENKSTSVFSVDSLQSSINEIQSEHSIQNSRHSEESVYPESDVTEDRADSDTLPQQTKRVMVTAPRNTQMNRYIGCTIPTVIMPILGQEKLFQTSPILLPCRNKVN